MGFIPADARWYLAEVVMEFHVDGDARNVVHINILLVEAGSPEEAYEKAIVFGREGEYEYENTEGRQVRVVFRGLRDLNVIHDPLEDGSELIYEEEIGVSAERLRTLVTPRDDLGVFAPAAPRVDGPNYFPREIALLLARMRGYEGGEEPS